MPFLTPTPYTPTQATPRPSASSNAVEKLIDYLDNNVRELPKSISYRSASELRRLMKLKKLRKEIDNIYEQMKIFEVKESNSVLRNFAKVYTIDGKLGYDPRSFLNGARENMIRVLPDNRNTKVKLKCYMEFPTTNKIKPADFHSNIEVNLDGTNEEDFYDIMVDRVLENIDKYIEMGSDVRFHSVIKFELHTVSYKPLREETWIPLPKELADKKAIINMQNKDNKCFLRCVLRYLYPDNKNPQRLHKKLMDKENTLNMRGSTTVSLKDINKFEKQNPTISITVLGYEGKGVYPLRNSTNMDRDYNIILMLIEEEEGVKHYCLVKNLCRLLSSQVSNHNGEHRFCLRCLNHFWCQESLNTHQEYWGNYEAVKIQMPKKGTMLKFKNYHRSEKVPFVVYADFECYNKPMQSCEPNPESSYTKQYQKHEPSSFCYYIKCLDDKAYKPKIVSYT